MTTHEGEIFIVKDGWKALDRVHVSNFSERLRMLMVLGRCEGSKIDPRTSRIAAYLS